MTLKLFHYLDKKRFGILLYFIWGFIVFFNTNGASFADDSLEIISDYDNYGWKGFIDSYGMSSVYFFHDAFSHFIYFLFVRNNILWYLLILFFHTSTAYFLYRYFINILNKTNRKFTKEIALISSLLFLNSAYNTETLFWIATYHYSISFLFLSIVLYNISNQNGTISKKYFLILLLIFAFFLTMHEITFFFPFAFFATIVYYKSFEKISLKKSLLLIRNYLIPFGIIETAVLILTKILKGTFIPHYGIEHLQNHGLYSFLYAFYQHIIKIFGMVHFMKFYYREKFYEVNESTMLIAFILCIILLISILIIKKIKLIEFKDIILISSLLGLFFIPISNMYFYWHYPILNDRLEYFLLPFLYFIFTFILFQLFQKKALFLTLGFLILNIILFRVQINKIQKSIVYHETIIPNSYKRYLEKEPVILNLPYTYNEFYCFRNAQRFINFISFKEHKKINFHYVSSMAFNSPMDSVEYKFINDSTIDLSMKADGSWFLYKSNGGIDFETKDLKVDFSDDNQRARILLKSSIKNSTILYCNGKDGFKEIEKKL